MTCDVGANGDPEAARRKIAALQPVILKERSAFAANEGPKLAEALCTLPPREVSHCIPGHRRLAWFQRFWVCPANCQLLIAICFFQ
jgi:hypothetical protein